MEEEFAKNAEVKQVKKRGPRPLIVAQSQAKNVRICMPAICSPAIYRIRDELGLASCDETIIGSSVMSDLILLPSPRHPLRLNHLRLAPFAKRTPLIMTRFRNPLAWRSQMVICLLMIFSQPQVVFLQ